MSTTPQQLYKPETAYEKALASPKHREPVHIHCSDLGEMPGTARAIENALASRLGADLDADGHFRFGSNMSAFGPLLRAYTATRWITAPCDLYIDVAPAKQDALPEGIEGPAMIAQFVLPSASPGQGRLAIIAESVYHVKEMRRHYTTYQALGRKTLRSRVPRVGDNPYFERKEAEVASGIFVTGQDILHAARKGGRLGNT